MNIAMKKKIYVCPKTDSQEMSLSSMLCLSGVNSGIGIDFGGIDEDGDQEVYSRGFSSTSFESTSSDYWQ